MRKLMLVLTASATLLGGCAASSQSQGWLNALMQACYAGDQYACAQVPQAQQQVAYEQQSNTNAAVAVGVGAALIGGIAAIAASSDGGRDRGYYRRGYRR